LLLSLDLLPGAPLSFQLPTNKLRRRKILGHGRPQSLEGVSNLATNAIMRLNSCILADNLLPAKPSFRLRDPEEIGRSFFAAHVFQNLAPFRNPLIEADVFRVEGILPQVARIVEDPKHLRAHTRLRRCLAQLLVPLGHLQADLDTRLAFLTKNLPSESTLIILAGALSTTLPCIFIKISSCYSSGPFFRGSRPCTVTNLTPRPSSLMTITMSDDQENGSINVWSILLMNVSTR
jgi:hypothetical protein